MLGQATPRLTDAFMELVGTRAQQKPSDPGDPGRRDNLHHARDDALRGSQAVHARRSSVALQIQKAASPLLGLAVLGGGVLASVVLRRRRHL